MPAARRQGERERERERKREKKRKGGRQGGRDHSRQRQAMMQTWSADVAHIGGHIVWGDGSQLVHVLHPAGGHHVSTCVTVVVNMFSHQNHGVEGETHWGPRVVCPALGVTCRGRWPCQPAQPFGLFARPVSSPPCPHERQRSAPPSPARWHTECSAARRASSTSSDGRPLIGKRRRAQTS